MELTDFKTKEVVDVLEVDAVLVATGRAPFTQARHLRPGVWGEGRKECQQAELGKAPLSQTDRGLRIQLPPGRGL